MGATEMEKLVGVEPQKESQSSSGNTEMESVMSDGIELGPSPQASEMSCVGGQRIFRFSRVVGRGLSSVGSGAWPLVLTSWARC